MLPTNNRMKGDTSLIIGVVIIIFVCGLTLVSVINSYVSVRSFFKENSNWFLAKDIAYRVVACTSSDYGILSYEKIADAKGCVGMSDAKYTFVVKDLDTGEEWKDSNFGGSLLGNFKEHTLFVAIEKPDGSVNRGVVHAVLYP